MTLLLITHEPLLAARCQRRLRMTGGRVEEVQETGAAAARVGRGEVA